MSAAGAVREMVEAILSSVTDALHSADAAQDERLTALEARVDALEKGTGTSARKVTVPRTKPTGSV